jgi:hypothetical protein
MIKTDTLLELDHVSTYGKMNFTKKICSSIHTNDVAKSKVLVDYCG